MLRSTRSAQVYTKSENHLEAELTFPILWRLKFAGRRVDWHPCTSRVRGHLMSELSEAQANREPLAAERAEKKLKAIPVGDLRVQLDRLLEEAYRTKRAGKRIRLILEAASTFAEPAMAVSACRRGCAFCCALPQTFITSAEARLLAAQTARPMQKPTRSIPVKQVLAGGMAEAAKHVFRQFPGVPCPFLIDNECAVYEHRPVVCRTHMNMDDDPLLCEVDPERPAKVPYLDSNGLLRAAWTLQADEFLADIRDFFPSP